ncbi:MAG: metallophosphoesterase [Limisphaerales bacterium]
MKLPCKFSRRKFIFGSLVGVPAVAVLDGFTVEPEWLAVNHVRLNDSPKTRLVHFTDVHHKGDRDYFEKVVRTINRLEPDIVCFTGDLIEEAEHLAVALEVVTQIKAPCIGVPGNHDYWAKVDFDLFKAPFESTGGGFLMDQSVDVEEHRIRFLGLTGGADPGIEPSPNLKNVLLTHYPAHVKDMQERKFDLALAGHSHGGQVRVPFLGPIFLPWRCGEYDLGYFDTKWGPLYVGSGIGYFAIPVRFNCRPEVTLIEI